VKTRRRDFPSGWD